jgi:carbamoyltransferase
MNSVANGKVRRFSSFRKVYVQSAAGDAGGAIGAAYAVWHRLGAARSFVMDHAYWGPHFGSREIKALIAAKQRYIADAGCTVQETREEAELCRSVAAAIAQGRIIGWFQGRMEWGPRALGNRSIICDPRRADMKSILNAKIKRREFIQTLRHQCWRDRCRNGSRRRCGSVHDAGLSDQAGSAVVPAVTHIDGSGRLQTVCHNANPGFIN